jgi:transposase InsO family protein
MDEWLNKILLKDVPLRLNSIGTNDSILLASHLSILGKPIPCVSLVDSGCTALACLDRSFAQTHSAPLRLLPRRQTLRLADGGFAGYITHFTVGRLYNGFHVEMIPLLITDLAPQHPVILGLPWLKRHSPSINWETLRLRFTDKCRGLCYPPDLPAPYCFAPQQENRVTLKPEPQRPTRLRYRSPTVEEVPDEGEPQEIQTTLTATVTPLKETLDDGNPSTGHKLSDRRRALQAFKQRAKRRGSATPRLTYGPPESRARIIPNRPQCLPLPAKIVVGQRRPMPTKPRPVLVRRCLNTIPPADPMNEEDVRLLSASNFMMLSRLKGVQVMRTTIAELEKLTEAKTTYALPDLPENEFRDILQGKGDLSYYRERLPAEFHDFLEICLSPDTPGTARLRRITEEDARKFFEKADKSHISLGEIEKRMPKQYRDLAHVALSQSADILPPHRSYDHKIELIPGNKLPYAKTRPMSQLELRVIKKWLDENLAKGSIRPSSSSVASPVLLAKKPGGGVRVCVDYRGINNITLKNRYPLPLIRETLDSLCRAKIYTKLDVIAAFNRVRITQGHEWLTAFITRFGLYETLVTPFGLQGAPATFQHYINDVLYDILDKYATAYLDDILIYSRNEKEHIQHVREVLKRLGAAGLQVDIDKCEFHTTKTKYLGLIITPGGIEMDPAKVKAILDWEPPQTKRQLQRFLGFANFYRRFIRDFSALAQPFHNLTRKDVKFDWNESCQSAFQALKEAFTTAPTLHSFDWSKPAVVEVDASNWSAGGVLSQTDDNGVLRPVAYFSAKHSAQECNYDIYDKELLAVVKALEEWRPELEGSTEPFDVVTDHKNLQTFATTKQLTPRHMRWAEFLSRFNFRIVYRAGSLNTRPDALSRKPEHVPATISDDRLAARRRPLIDPRKFDAQTFPELRLNGLRLYELDISRSIDDLIDEGYANSPMMAELKDCLIDPERREWTPTLKKSLRIPFAECAIKAGRAYFRDRLIIPLDDTGLQLQVIHRTHASAPGGHPGRVKTLDLMNRVYWWPGMSLAVRAFCKACLLCDKTKNPRTSPAGFLKPIPIPFQPWRDINVDYITPLPDCERRGQTFRHIAVVVDRLTKLRHFIPTETLSAEELADRFVDRVYTLHGCPETIISDRGTQFVSTFWRQLSTRLGILLRPSSAYHAQTNGQVERINAELEQYLRLYIDWAQDDWVDWLPLAEFAGNNTVSETTGITPFFATYGFHPRMGVEPARPCPPNLTAAQRTEFLKANEIAARFEAILSKVQALAKQANDRYEANANRKRQDAPKYKKGDMVMLDMSNMDVGRPVDKLSPKWEGPFRVTKASSHAVTIALPANMKIFNTFHVSRVRRRTAPGIPGQEESQGDVRANRGREVVRTDNHQEVQEWRFEEILDFGKADNGRWQYLVKWEGHKKPTWQPATDLRGCDDAIWKFHDAHPEKPGPPTWVPRRKTSVKRVRFFSLREGVVSRA